MCIKAFWGPIAIKLALNVTNIGVFLNDSVFGDAIRRVFEEMGAGGSRVVGKIW
jgi:hypothetical protein